MKNSAKFFVVALAFATLTAVAGAQETVDLPIAVNAERLARNEAYRQRLYDARMARRQKQHQAASLAAQQRAVARRERLSTRAYIEPSPQPHSPTRLYYDLDLNGEKIESLNTTWQRRYNAGLDYLGSGYSRVGYRYVNGYVR